MPTTAAVPRIRAVCLLALALGLARPASGEAPGDPNLVCDAPVYDFGTVTDVAEVQHTFILRNTGTVPLEITRVKPACGCTTAALTANSIPPGGSVELSSRLSLAGRTGEQRKAIHIGSNDPDTPEYKLELTGTIHRDVEIRPPQVVLQRSNANPAPRAEVRVVFNGAQPCRITGMDTNRIAFCTAAWREIRPGQEYAVDLVAHTNLTAAGNTITGELALQTDHPKHPQVLVPAVLTQVRDIIVAPSQLIVPRELPPGTPYQQQVLVRNRTSDAIDIVSITPPADGIRVTTNKLAAAMYRLDVSFSVAPAAFRGKVITIDVRRQEGATESYDLPIHVLER